MRALAIAGLLLASAPALSQNFTGVTFGSPSVTAKIDCRSFGQTATEGGTLNIKYGDPVMCWGSDTTVGGTPVNDTGWTPEVFFEWDWDDSSLGTVSRGGLTVDLGESIGLVAAHAYRPSSFAESCNSGTNSLHTVTLTVTSLVGGSRASDSDTVSVCVENPATTWPNPVAYCDDADCSNDTFTGVVNPGTPTHGGNGTDLATILNSCDSVSRRILLEGGVTFTTVTDQISMGSNRCLIESYGGSKSKLHINNSGSSHAVEVNTTCSGVVFNNLTFRGAGANPTVGPRLISPSANGAGCYALIETDESGVAGEEMGGTTVFGGTSSLGTEMYYFKHNKVRQNAVAQILFIYGSYIAVVGSELHDSNVLHSHNIRLPQWDHVVIDATSFKNQDNGSHLLTMRQDCGTSPGCPNHAEASLAAITRNYFEAQSPGSDPIQLCNPGSGTSEETKCYDVDYARNVMTSLSGNASPYVTFSNNSGGERQRIRFIQNAVDLTSSSSSSTQAFNVNVTGASDLVFLGNVVTDQSASGTVRVSDVGSAADSVRNNVCFETGSGACDQFPAVSEDGTNQSETTDPFDRVAGNPGTAGSFVASDLLITSSNTALKGQGGITGIPTDIEGETLPQSSDEDAGIDDE